MSWVGQLAELTEHQPLGVAVDWGHIESGLGTPIPPDFKELCEAFGQGEFNGYLMPYFSRGGRHLEVLDRVAEIRRVFDRNPDAETLYAPHGFYVPGKGGLIPWGATGREGEEFFWASGPGDPDSWPTVARTLTAEGLRTFDMTASEFLYRALTEPEFKPFSAVRYAPRPQFSSYLEE